jgi:TPR repeat protein
MLTPLTEKFAGVEEMTVPAARLYKLAADQGSPLGQTNPGVLYELGRGGLAKDDWQAARLYKLAADQGYATGLDNRSDDCGQLAISAPA